MNNKTSERLVGGVRGRGGSLKCGFSFESAAKSDFRSLKTSERAYILANSEKYDGRLTLGVLRYGKQKKTGK